MKQGDTAPSLLIDTNADLTGTTTKVAKIRRRHDDTWVAGVRTHPSVVTKTLSIVGPAADGVLEYQWIAGDTDVLGTYEIDAAVTFASGKVEHFPQGSDLELIIEEKAG